METKSEEKSQPDDEDAPLDELPQLPQKMETENPETQDENPGNVTAESSSDDADPPQRVESEDGEEDDDETDGAEDDDELTEDGHVMGFHDVPHDSGRGRGRGAQ